MAAVGYVVVNSQNKLVVGGRTPGGNRSNL